MKWMKATILFAAAGLVFAASAAAQENTPVSAPDGAVLYDDHCKTCHGPAGGAPSPAMLRMMENLSSITDPAFLAETPDDSLISVAETGRGKMKPFADKLSHEEILAIVWFLRTFEVAAPAPSPEVPEVALVSGNSARGAAVYRSECAACHGEEGKGDGSAAAALTPRPPDLTRSEHLQTMSDEELLQYLSVGAGSMPGYDKILTEEELTDVVAWLRAMDDVDR
jgi:cytochrome c oxidase cbb3-type subunit 3